MRIQIFCKPVKYLYLQFHSKEKVKIHEEFLFFVKHLSHIYISFFTDLFYFKNLLTPVIGFYSLRHLPLTDFLMGKFQN